jgi:hypothetical protein
MGAAIGVALLYFLSAGPALLLAQRRVVATETVVAIYFGPHAPLEILTSIVPGADWLTKRYVGYWESLTPAPPPHL